MNEEEIAEKKVIPFLEGLGWPKQLLTKYGRVPVQMGTEVKYADIVALFVDDNNITFPYLVVEVKKTLENIEGTKAQVNSYAKQLDAQVFLVTDGATYQFYQRSPLGGYIQIQNLAIPEKKYLQVDEKTNFKMSYVLAGELPVKQTRLTVPNKELEKAADNFFDLITSQKYFLGKNGYSLRGDIAWHYWSIKKIHKLIQEMEIDKLERKTFRNIFDTNVMCQKIPNANKILSEVKNNFEKVKTFLKFLRDFKGSAQENLSRLFDTTDRLHIKGMGPFIISQFLAGAHPTDYTIIEDRMVNTLKEFKLIDVKVHSETPNGYLYINDMCKKLLRDVFKEKIENDMDNFEFRIGDDFGLVVMHEFFWEYAGFYGYDKTKLRQAAGKELENEIKNSNANLQEIKLLTQNRKHPH